MDSKFSIWPQPSYTYKFKQSILIQFNSTKTEFFKQKNMLFKFIMEWILQLDNDL